VSVSDTVTTATYELPVKILTSPFDSLTPISLYGVSGFDNFFEMTV